MIDLCAHIIPEVDNSDNSLVVSSKTLKPAYDAGVTAVCAPPHLCGEIDLGCEQRTIFGRDSNAPKNTEVVFISSSAGGPADDRDHKKLGFDFIGGTK